MAENGISTLPTKEQRQKAKLDLASAKRAATGRPHTYDLSQLPAKYDGNSVVNNANSAGLILGRPWAADRITDNIELENNFNLLTENSELISLGEKNGR